MWTIVLTIVVTVVATIGLSTLKRNLATPERKLDYRLQEFAVGSPTFERCMAHLLGPPLVDGNRIISLQNGDEIFPAMLNAIRSAQATITFETYIYWSGKIGREFAHALAERARTGVRVHVILDWLGSNKLDAAALQEMQGAGVQVERYRPLELVVPRLPARLLLRFRFGGCGLGVRMLR
jgi:cardiolipin synthase